MTISEKAAQKLRDDLIKRFLDAGLGFRVASDGYEHISIGIDRKGDKDKVLETSGILVIADSSAAALLTRYELDYIEGPDGGFCLKDPDAVDPAASSRKTQPA